MSRENRRSVRRQVRDSPYLRFLKLNDFNSPDTLGWSGKGNHVEYQRHGDVPLTLGDCLGRGSYAIVQRVICSDTDKRPLAQKIILDYRTGGIEKVMTEVKCIQHLRHRHIVQLVGTYVVRWTLHILLFPVGQWNLRQFLQEFEDEKMESKAYPDFYSLGTFFKCLACGVAYLHEEVVPHIINLDIKPENIIVRRCSDRRLSVFITDFGVSRSFQPSSPSTDANTLYTTPIYQAPEIAKKREYGRKADIFSLGCVYSEMATILAGKTVQAYSKHREHTLPGIIQPSIAFESNLGASMKWLEELKSLSPLKKPSTGRNIAWWSSLLDRIEKMMSAYPDDRYTSEELVNSFPPGPCCRVPLEEYQVLEQSLQASDCAGRLASDHASTEASPSLTSASTPVSEEASEPASLQDAPSSAFQEVEIAPDPEPQIALLTEPSESDPSLPQFDWSGKGFHAQYDNPKEVPLQLLEMLGAGAASSVLKVQTTNKGPYVFAQKSLEIRGHRLRLEMLMREVEVLQKLRHPHIVRLTGTAYDKRFFSILTYPAADWNLTNFMEQLEGEPSSSRDPIIVERKEALLKFTTCLIHALEYLHRRGIRHKDIKPSNILVQRWGTEGHGYHVYLSDFGISTQMGADDISVTTGPASYTPRYASPETLRLERRGRASDIFSMGCVWVEMYTVIIGETLASLSEHLETLSGAPGDDYESDGVDDGANAPPVEQDGSLGLYRHSAGASYASRLKSTVGWIHRLRNFCTMHASLIGGECGKFSGLDISAEMLETRLDYVESMIEEDPHKRPVAPYLCRVLEPNDCCTSQISPYDTEIAQAKSVPEMLPPSTRPNTIGPITHSPAQSTHSVEKHPIRPQTLPAQTSPAVPTRSKLPKIKRWMSSHLRRASTTSSNSNSRSPERTTKSPLVRTATGLMESPKRENQNITPS